MPAFLRPPLPSTSIAWGVVLLVVSTVALAQGKGIYTCIDSKGRRITSDRPITECLDREQRELTGSGTVKRVVPPSYTAEERARIDAQKKADEALQARIAEEKRRDRALLIRYPNKPVHDKERTDALAQIDEVISAVNKRAQALLDQRKDISAELEFYQNDVSKAPLWLRRKLEDNEQQVAVQQRFVVEQTQEKQRLNARFDEELVKLRQLWGQK
ncbi:MAG TPA: DUF4124 domain-containing protein [Hydrogenophaga sp.]|uniref:DUF4124 domain-containing protein n=1 Tax=Hydrogenophaga sp. TaxID=1904254 RepID=UPI000B33A6E6|nr:DUF4124 domain-containing protein [Hydrogenophaga sp.]HAX19202.1 DUF4124 domain-containing protein [Hydrogenophaga sp.]HBU18862.1 DUF4124 domain-containing protein [Hydrogenophaga sp.]